MLEFNEKPTSKEGCKISALNETEDGKYYAAETILEIRCFDYLDNDVPLTYKFDMESILMGMLAVWDSTIY